MDKDAEKPNYIFKLDTGRGYTEKDRIEALKLIAMHGSIKKVHELTGIARRTLMKWAENSVLATKAGDIDLKKIADKVEVNLVRKDSNFIDNIYAVKQKALSKMETLIDDSTSLRDVTQAMAVLHAVSQGGDFGKDGLTIVNNVTNTLVQKISNLQKEKQNERHPVIPIEHSEEC